MFSVLPTKLLPGRYNLHGNSLEFKLNIRKKKNRISPEASAMLPMLSNELACPSKANIPSRCLDWILLQNVYVSFVLLYVFFACRHRPRRRGVFNRVDYQMFHQQKMTQSGKKINVASDHIGVLISNENKDICNFMFFS